jgi:hypothetical protein
MLNSDKIKLNSILTSISESVLRVSEVNAIDNVYDVYGSEKDYYDAIVQIVLPLRKATNTSYRAFYRVAKENGIDYSTQKVAISDLFIIGGSNLG